MYPIIMTSYCHGLSISPPSLCYRRHDSHAPVARDQCPVKFNNRSKRRIGSMTFSAGMVLIKHRALTPTIGDGNTHAESTNQLRDRASRPNPRGQTSIQLCGGKLYKHYRLPHANVMRFDMARIRAVLMRAAECAKLSGIAVWVVHISISAHPLDEMSVSIIQTGGNDRESAAINLARHSPMYEYLEADRPPSGPCARRRPNSSSLTLLPATMR